MRRGLGRRVGGRPQGCRRAARSRREAGAQAGLTRPWSMSASGRLVEGGEYSAWRMPSLAGATPPKAAMAMYPGRRDAGAAAYGAPQGQTSERAAMGVESRPGLCSRGGG